MTVEPVAIPLPYNRLWTGILAGLFVLAGVYRAEYLASEYLPYFMLLGFAEAWLSGMVTTLFVVYRPEGVSSFEDAQYLGKK